MRLDNLTPDVINGFMRRHVIWAAILVALTAAATHASSTPKNMTSCSLSKEDRAWLDRAVQSWIVTRRDILRAPSPASLDASIFDERCALTSRTALITGRSRWVSSPLEDRSIALGAQRIPVGVFSATIGDASGAHFYMSVPSVWKKAKIPPGKLGLERLMTAVMMHEATHVFQRQTYGAQIDQVQKQNALTDDQFNDDAIQSQFGKEVEFAASVQRETDLFFKAANTANEGDARRLALEARELMRTRERRYFVGGQAYQVRAEDLWLTMEGSAQWVGFQWLQMPVAKFGGGLSTKDAVADFGRRGGSWTQTLGLAVAMTVNRFRPADWKLHAFDDGQLTLLEMLDQSLRGERS